MECTPTPHLDKQPKVISNTRTPMSTIQEIHGPFLPPISFSPKDFQDFEITMMKKFDFLFAYIANKGNSTLKLENQEITPSDPDDENLISVAGHLNFDDTTTKDNVTIRRSKRLSKLGNVDSEDSCKNSPPLPPPRKQAPTPAPSKTVLHEGIFKVPVGRAPKAKCLRKPFRYSKKLEAFIQTNTLQSPRPQVASEEIPVPAHRNFIVIHYNHILSVLNNGSETQLQKLPGVGPKSATQIYVYRKLSGPFNRVEDLGEMKAWNRSSYKRFLRSNFLD